MFTGIIEEIGHVVRIKRGNRTRGLRVSCGRLGEELSKGASIAVSGVCLTAVEIGPETVAFDLAEETWKRTSFSRIKEGALVNLELPMRANARFDGHIVQGHVDGVGKLVALEPVEGANDYWLRIEIPPELTRYVVAKGSLCIEGISLTVASIEGVNVTAAIIPHTFAATNLKSLQPGDAMNLEVDIVAKYVEKMIAERAASSIKLEELMEAGF